MPFASEKQRRYLWSQKPEVAKKFVEDQKAMAKSIRKRGKKHA